MPVLNNQTVGNSYPTTPGSGASLSDIWNSRGGWFSVTGAGAYVELQYGDQGSAYWVEEILLGAGAFVVLPPNCRGIQFRNSVANAIATVTAQIAQGDEPPLAISTIGQTNVVSVASLNFQHGGVAVGTEPTVDFVDGANLTWALADDVANTRVTVTPTITGVVTSVDGRTGAVTGVADLTSAATQAFTGAITATEVSSETASGLVANAVTAGGNAFRSYLVNGDANPAFRVLGDGTLNWGPGGASVTDTTLGRVSAGFVGGSSGVAVTRASASTIAYAAAVSGDTVNRLLILADGTIQWGPGNGAVDTTLFRAAASQLQTDDQFRAAYPGTGGPSVYVTGSTEAIRSVVTAANTVLSNHLLAADAQPAFRVLGDGTLGWGAGGASLLDTTMGRLAAAVLGNAATALSTGPTSASVTGGQTAGAILSVNGQLGLFNSAMTSAIYSALLTDTQARWIVNTAGQLQWGAGGASAQDVTVQRTAAGTLSFGTTTQTFRANMFVTGTANVFLAAFVTTDTNPRWQVAGDGTVSWGPGNAGVDTSISRSLTNPATAHLAVSQPFAISGSIYQALLSVTVTPTTSYTIDYSTQPNYFVTVGGTGGGTITFNAPTTPPATNAQGGTIFMKISNPAGNSATTLSWNAAFQSTSVTLPTSIAGAAITYLLFVWDGSNWRLMVKA